MKPFNKVKALVKGIVEGPFQKRQKDTFDERAEYNKESFVNHFNLPKEISGAVWDILCSDESVEGFKPHPTDDLAFMFGLADDDLDEIILNILSSSGRKFPTQEAANKIAPLINIEDLVVFLSQCPSNK